LGLACAVAAGGCVTHEQPKPEPMTILAPPPPEAEIGRIRVYGRNLPADRAAAVRDRLRESEPRILGAYEQLLADGIHDPGGRLQVRIGVNHVGKVAELTPIESDLSDELQRRVREAIETVDFGPGDEAFLYYAMEFRPEPFEVLAVQPEFQHEPPMLVADVVNRSGFRLPGVALTVRVLGPRESEPLRVFRRRFEEPFEPGERRALRVPMRSELASDRNSFLVEAAPAFTNGAAAR
jgi:hypothetical protein